MSGGLGIALYLMLFLGLLFILFLRVLPESFLWGFVNLAVFVVNMWFFFRYMRDCGSYRERILTLVSLLLAQVCSLVFLIGPIAKLRNATDQMVISSNLKDIVFAMYRYSDDRGTFPPAFMDGPVGEGGKRHRVSWRVLLLPYLYGDASHQTGYAEVFRQYRLDEPWDSPNNLKLLPQMPRVYARPVSKTGHTSYRVFVSKVENVGNCQIVKEVVTGPSAAFEEGRGVRFPAGFPDGSSNTILVVDATESVPWTMPDELVYEPDKPLPSLGMFGKSTFQAGMADGSVRAFRKKGDQFDRELRAWITRDGGEIAVDP